MKTKNIWKVLFLAMSVFLISNFVSAQQCNLWADCSSCSNWVMLGPLKVRDNDANGKYDQVCFLNMVVGIVPMKSSVVITTTTTTTTTTMTTTTTSTTSTTTSTTTRLTTTTTTSTTTTTTTTLAPTSTTTTTTTSTTTTTTTTTSTTTTTTTTTLPKTKCWSAYPYLQRNSNQMKKFCKCAQGTYSYKSYYSSGSKNAQYYTDSGNNNNWATKISSQYRPVYQVKCYDNKWYSVNKDYYRS